MMMTADEFEVRRNQLTEEIHQLEAEIRDQQEKIETLIAARNVMNERRHLYATGNSRGSPKLNRRGEIAILTRGHSRLRSTQFLTSCGG